MQARLLWHCGFVHSCVDRLLQAVLSKQLNVFITQTTLHDSPGTLVSDAKCLVENPWDHPQTSGGRKNVHLSTNHLLYLKMAYTLYRMLILLMTLRPFPPQLYFLRFGFFLHTFYWVKLPPSSLVHR